MNSYTSNEFEFESPEPSHTSRLLTIIKILLACGILIFLYLQIQPNIPYLNTLYNKLKEYKQVLSEPKKVSASQEIQVKSSGKQIDNPKPNNGGFCYIGEWNGTRSCIDVNSLDECYSGEIYDSKNKCTNKK